jgi:hypothetical protein
MYYTLGRGRGGNVYVYALKLKQWVFSNELVLTGNAEIDGQIKDAYPRTQISLRAGGSGIYVPDEIVYQGANVATATATAIDTRTDKVFDFTLQFGTANASNAWVISEATLEYLDI